MTVGAEARFGGHFYGKYNDSNPNKWEKKHAIFDRGCTSG